MGTDEDIVHSDPNEEHVLDAVRSLDLLVVQDLFLTEMARHAHLVLPAAAVYEQEGTFTNGERRMQLVRRAVAPPGEAGPDWLVSRDVANALGASWNYASPAQVMDEATRVAPRLFGGISFARLEGDGIQWLCPSADHPGTSTVHADGFLRGKGKLSCVPYVPSPELVDEQYPFLLSTGLVLQQYNVGTMTRRMPHQQLAPTDGLEMHPDDAIVLGIRTGEVVEITSRWGQTRVPLRTSRRVAPGRLFLSFHQPESHVNKLTSRYADPQSKCPEYRIVAVRVKKISDF